MADPFLALALLEQVCPECHGGASSATRRRDCPTCKGAGEVPLIPGLRVPCQSCDGTGKVYSHFVDGHNVAEQPHAQCEGRGWAPLHGPEGGEIMRRFCSQAGWLVESYPEHGWDGWDGEKTEIVDWAGEGAPVLGEAAGISPESLARAVLDAALLAAMQPLAERHTGAADSYPFTVATDTNT